MGPGAIHNQLMELVKDKKTLWANPVIILDEAGSIAGSYMMAVGDQNDKDLAKDLVLQFKAKSCWTGM